MPPWMAASSLQGCIHGDPAELRSRGCQYNKTSFLTTKRKTKMNTSQLPQERRQRCEVWTRVMGYHRPVSAFNKGKQSEHRERQHFTETASR